MPEMRIPYTRRSGSRAIQALEHDVQQRSVEAIRIEMGLADAILCLGRAQYRAGELSHARSSLRRSRQAFSAASKKLDWLISIEGCGLSGIGG